MCPLLGAFHEHLDEGAFILGQIFLIRSGFCKAQASGELRTNYLCLLAEEVGRLLLCSCLPNLLVGLLRGNKVNAQHECISDFLIEEAY